MRGVNLDMLVTAALTGRNYNHSRFGEAVKRYARKISNRSCPHLPEDLHEDIAQQAMVELFAAGSAGLVSKSGTALLRSAILSAIRVVRSNYTEPGRRTRPPKKGEPEPVALVAAEHADAILDGEAVVRVADPTEGEAMIDFDLIESPVAAYAVRRMEDGIELDWALRRAPPNIAAALRLVCIEGETLSTAAMAVSISRFSLSRRMDSFCPLWRDAA
jgi:DNA-directed RNA polymerase specialized sigma24 family protein